MAVEVAPPTRSYTGGLGAELRNARGAVAKDPVQGRTIWLDYPETVGRGLGGWKGLDRACREVAA